MARRVEFHPLAETDLFDLYKFVEGRAGPIVAGGYIERIEALCASLKSFSARGVPRDDLAPGVRTTSLERRVLVAYRTTNEAVVILRVLYAGRDFGIDQLPH